MTTFIIGGGIVSIESKKPIKIWICGALVIAISLAVFLVITLQKYPKDLEYSNLDRRTTESIMPILPFPTSADTEVFVKTDVDYLYPFGMAKTVKTNYLYSALYTAYNYTINPPYGAFYRNFIIQRESKSTLPFNEYGNVISDKSVEDTAKFNQQFLVATTAFEINGDTFYRVNEFKWEKSLITAILDEKGQLLLFFIDENNEITAEEAEKYINENQGKMDESFNIIAKSFTDKIISAKHFYEVLSDFENSILENYVYGESFVIANYICGDRNVSFFYDVKNEEVCGVYVEP